MWPGCFLRSKLFAAPKPKALKRMSTGLASSVSALFKRDRSEKAVKHKKPSVAGASEFVSRTWEMLNGDDIEASWSGDGTQVVVVNPERLDETLDQAHEAEMEGFGDLRRLVRRNDATVDAVLVRGRVAARAGVAADGFGRQAGFGTVLRAGA